MFYFDKDVADFYIYLIFYFSYFKDFYIFLFISYDYFIFFKIFFYDIVISNSNLFYHFKNPEILDFFIFFDNLLLKFIFIYFSFTLYYDLILVIQMYYNFNLKYVYIFVIIFNYNVQISSKIPF